MSTSLYTKDQLLRLFKAWEVEPEFPTTKTDRVIAWPRPNPSCRIAKVNRKFFSVTWF